MTIFLTLFLAVGLAPLAAGILSLPPAARKLSARKIASSALLCALAFNLAFFWQELWLVIPKALTPGLHPVLFHNNHDWTGQASTVELLQGTGALANLGLGLACAAVLAAAPELKPGWRGFFYWMAVQGLFQALTQLAIGTGLSGNDVGRALAYLHVGAAGAWILLAAAVAGMAAAGVVLRRIGGCPRPNRTSAWEILAAVLAATVITVPFRMPRDIVEVLLVPLFINVTCAAWLVLGAAATRRSATGRPLEPAHWAMPALALAAVLVLFQAVLRPGIAF